MKSCRTDIFSVDIWLVFLQVATEVLCADDVREKTSECMIQNDSVYVVDEIQKTDSQRKQMGQERLIACCRPERGWLGDKKGRASSIDDRLEHGPST